MMQLYYAPGACSMAVHAILNELALPFELKPVDVYAGEGQAPEFLKLNPCGQIPVLVVDDMAVRETAAIIMYLMDEYKSTLMPRSGKARTIAVEWLMFANATLQTAYSKASFALKNTTDPVVKDQLFDVALARIDKLWEEVDAALLKNRYICGKDLSAADFLLAVIANWGNHHPRKPTLGPNIKRMLREIIVRPSFAKALKIEQVEYKNAV